MPTQSYGGSGLFGQPSFGDYSGLSGGVPVPMTLEEIQKQLGVQDNQFGGLPIYYDLYNTQEVSPFKYNVGSRVNTVRAAENNPYLDAPPDRIRTALSQADYIKQQQGVPLSLMATVDAINVRDDQVDTSSNVAPSQTALPVNIGSSGTRLVSDSPIVSGVFPEVEAMQRALYQQKQNEAMQAQAMQFARLSPMEQAQYSLYMGGQQLGGAIGSALGGKDPQLQMIGLQSRILSELDPSDPNQQLLVARKYAQAAPELAMRIADNARSSLVKIAQANKEQKLSIAPRVQEAQQAASVTQAIAQYKLMPQTPEIVQAIQTLEAQLDFLKPKAEATPNEIQLATKFALQKGAEGTQAFNTEFNSQLLRLTTKETNPPAKEEIFDLVDKIKTLDPVKDKFEYDTYKARIEKLNKGKSLEETIGESFGILGKALVAGQKKEFEKTGEYSAENFKNLGSSVAAGTASKRNLATLENSLDNAFTGKFTEGKAAIVSSLISLGIPVGSDLKNATSNTELIQAMGTRYIFPLVKNYPGSLAAKELASLEKTAPNALQQPETIKRLVNLLKVDLAENEYTYNRAKDYKKSNKESLIGFNEADSRIEFQNKLGRLQELVTTIKSRKSATNPQGFKNKAEDDEINQLRKELYIGG